MSLSSTLPLRGGSIGEICVCVFAEESVLALQLLREGENELSHLFVYIQLIIYACLFATLMSHQHIITARARLLLCLIALALTGYEC